MHEPVTPRIGSQAELDEITKIIGADKGAFEIVSSQRNDSLGSGNWRKYVTNEALMQAWSPPKGSIYKSFMRTRTINSMSALSRKIRPRFSFKEVISLHQFEELIQEGLIDRETAFILNMGGAHSVALAARLAEIGVQPVIMFDSIPHSRGVVRSEQDLAVMLYYAEYMNGLRNTLRTDAPPAFILDAHRDDLALTSWGKYNNGYIFTPTDFPSIDTLPHVRKIIYIREGYQRGERFLTPYKPGEVLQPDMSLVLKSLNQSGMPVFTRGISVIEDDFTHLRSKENRRFT